MLVYYEDIMSDFSDSARRITTFLELQEIPEPRKQVYSAIDLNPGFRKKIDNLYRKHLGDLYEEYLGRYAE